MTATSDSSHRALALPYLLIIVGVLLGMLFSGVLIYEHNGAKTDLGAAVCDVGQTSSCEKASQSSMGKLFGMSLALFGFIFYGGLLALAVLLIFALNDTVLSMLFWATIAGLLFDIFLLLYSITVLGGLCRLCTITYIATGLIMGGAYLLRKRGEIMMKVDKIPVKAIAAFVVVLAATVGGGLFFNTNAIHSQQAAATAGSAEELKLRTQLNNEFYKQWKASEKLELNNPATGSQGAASPILIITEFADPLCPHCKSMGIVLDEFVKKNSQHVRLVFRHYPLDIQCNDAMKRAFHVGACDLARAMECGQAQGKFWQVHDAVFAAQDEFMRNPITEKNILDLATAAGVNPPTLGACMRNQSTMAKVKTDVAVGNRIKITGTPTTLINGRRLPGVPLEYVSGILEKILAEESKK